MGYAKDFLSGSVRKSARNMALAMGSAFMGLSLAATSPAAAVDFSGKRIELTVPFGEGGGTDTYSRFFAPYLERYLPGNPSIIVRNFPGGGSVTGANRFWNRSQPDGTDVLALSTSTLTAYLLRDERVEYKVEEFIPIILSASGIIVYGSPATGITGEDIVADVEALRQADLIFGGQAANTSEMATLVALSLLDIDLRPVFGISRGNARQAFQRGEFNINYDSSAGYLSGAVPLVEAGQAVPLFTLGFINEDGRIVRDPSFPDLPSFPEVYEKVHGQPLSGPPLQAYTAIVGVNVMASKALALPPGTPDEIVQAYRDAIAAIMDDPDYQAGADDFVGDYPQLVGDAAARVIEASAVMPDAGRDWLREWLMTNYEVEIP